MTRVFIVERSHKHDLSNIKHTVVELFDSTTRRPNIFQPDAYSRAVARRLAELKYDHEQDLVLLTGNLLSLFQLGLVLGQYPSVRVLMFDARSESYEEATWTRSSNGLAH